MRSSVPSVSPSEPSRLWVALGMVSFSGLAWIGLAALVCG